MLKFFKNCKKKERIKKVRNFEALIDADTFIVGVANKRPMKGPLLLYMSQY